MWCWDTRAHAQAAVALAHAGQLPGADAAFALTTDHATELTDVVDER